MTCPDWRALAAAREADPLAEIAGWHEARTHAAACSRCREAALAVDPLLLFAREPQRSVSSNEISDMQASVMALVRASRVANGEAVARPEPPKRLLSASRIAAAIGVCSLLALSGAPRSSSSGAAMAVAAMPDLLSAELAPAEALPAGSVVEELDRPGARIYEMPQGDVAVVMIVDASLDV